MHLACARTDIAGTDVHATGQIGRLQIGELHWKEEGQLAHAASASEQRWASLPGVALLWVVLQTHWLWLAAVLEKELARRMQVVQLGSGQRCCAARWDDVVLIQTVFVVAALLGSCQEASCA